MTTFIERPADYLGETVTVTPRHALDGDRAVKVCDDPTHEGMCAGAPVVADGPLAGRDVRDRWDNYDGRHRWQVRRRSPFGGAR